MTPKQTEKLRILHAKLTAGIKVKPSEYPAWQRNAGNGWRWTPADETRNEATMRGEYESHMRSTHGDSWEPNPAAVNWSAYLALESGVKCDTCGRPGLDWCQTCRNWLERISDRKRIRPIVTPQVAA